MTDKDNSRKLDDLVVKMDLLLASFGPTTEDKKEQSEVSVIKQFSPEKLEIVEPLYIAGGSVDGHGDAYKDPVEGPEKLVKAIKEGRAAKTLQSSLFHKHKTKGFEIVDEWVNKEAAVLEDGTEIPANMPLGLIKFNSEALYNARVEGRIGGLSMGAKGLVEVVTEKDYDSFLSDLDTSETPLRVISDFIFTHKAAHYAYTSWSQGGAASKLNEPVAIMKSKQILSEDENKILEDIGEEYTELDKAKKAISESAVETAPSTSEVEALDAGVDNQTENKGHQMSIEQDPKYLEMVKKLNAMEIKEDLLPFNLEKSVASKAATAMAELTVEQRADIIATFEVIKSAGDAKVAELESANEDLNKSLSSKQDLENPVAALLNKEQGEGSAPVDAPAKPLTAIQEAALKFNSKKSK